MFQFYVCLQMHDIVKAVGNCSYNQLVEKIISCKQSDNSELAGEGGCCPPPLSPPLLSDLPPVSSSVSSSEILSFRAEVLLSVNFKQHVEISPSLFCVHSALQTLSCE